MENDANKVKKTLAGVFKKTQSKDCTAIQKAFELYLKRLDERVAYAKKHLGSKFKFDETVKIMLDPDERKRPKNEKDVNKWHNDYIQYQVSTYLASGSKLEEAKSQVLRSYERFQKRMKETQGQDLWAIYLDAFARGL